MTAALGWRERRPQEDPLGKSVVPCLVLAGLLALGCAPKVQVEAPKEPIVINMNIKIEHEIRVKVDEDLEDLFAEESDIF